MEKSIDPGQDAVNHGVRSKELPAGECVPLGGYVFFVDEMDFVDFVDFVDSAFR
jgi:hypothetical protein